MADDRIPASESSTARPLAKRVKMKGKNKLPRGIRRRGNALVVSFAGPDGRIERRSLGPVSLQFAEEQRKIFQRQVREGVYVGCKPRVKETVYTVADLWDVYLRTYRNRGGKDDGRLVIAWNHLKPMFERKRVDEVSTALIEEYIAARQAERMQNATINRECAALRAAFIRGTKVTPRMVISLPAFPSRLPENPPRKGFIVEAQYKTLVANAKQLWLRALIACAYSFGFRKGELLNLHVRQVDLLDRWIELEEGTTKNNEARKVKMTPEVFELLSACCLGKKPDDFVFTREACAQVVDPRKEWYDLCVSSGLGRWVPAKRKNGEEFNAYRGLNLHDFRRSAIRNMTRRGVSETVAMKISGHKTISVFKRYNIVDERDLAEATRLIEAGRQQDVSGSKTDTKSDTSTYAHS
jgi:integrase